MNHQQAQTTLAAAGLPPTLLNNTAHQLISKYFEQRLRWSSTHNVAGPRSMASPWGLDLPDAIAAAHCLATDLPLVDVGTGSGTPGVIIACLKPNTPIYLVEPIAKRTAFLRSVTRELGLNNVSIIRARWPQDLPDRVVQVISRAVVSPESWPHLATARAPGTDHVLRMLAAQRPPVSMLGYAESAHINYDLAVHGERRVERWSPKGPSAL